MKRIRFEVPPAGDGRWNIARDSVVVDWCDKKDDAVAQAVTRCPDVIRHRHRAVAR